MSHFAGHEKVVDSPNCHRGSRRVSGQASSHTQTFHIGDSSPAPAVNYGSSQRFRCKTGQGASVSPAREEVPAQQWDSNLKVLQTSSPKHEKACLDNSDWTQNTGSSVQKVLPNEKPHYVHHSEWDTNKVIPNSAKREGHDRPPKVIENERRKKPVPGEHRVEGWNTDSMKTLPKEEKRQLNLAKPLPVDPPAKPIVRPEDWDSNLKTLPDGVRRGSAPRHPHTFDDIKKSVAY